MNKILKYINSKSLWTLLFSACCFVFWYFFYSGHILYQEQFQMFLFSREYLIENISIPGGMSQYVSKFLTQFYLSPIAGASIITILLVTIQLQISSLMRSLKTDISFYFVSFIPSIALWIAFLDEHTMNTLPVSIIINILFIQIFQFLHLKIKYKLIASVLLLPLLFWISGAMFFLFSFWWTVYIFKYFKEKASLLSGVIIGLLLLTESALLPILSQYIIQYPLSEIFNGLGYYRFPGIITIHIRILEIFLVLILCTFGIFRIKTPLKPSTQLIIINALFCTSIFLIVTKADFDKEEVMNYDTLIRNGEWNKIIKLAEIKSPTSPFSVASLNLALSKSGQLPDRMFEFYQNGVEGLIPSFQRDFYAPLISAEIFYQLGMINSSQRFIFEAMEAIPDYQKSAIAYKHLTKTALINGEYGVAAKYINALSKTLFYREWANKVQEIILEPNKISSFPELLKLQKLRYEENFLFSDNEMDAMLGRLFQHNPSNKMAFEYLAAYALQKKDISSFLKFYPLGKDLGYDHIPKSYQEALIFMWTQTHSNFQGLPWSISEKTLSGVTEFANIYMKQKNPETILKEKYEKTFWYYLLFNK